MKNFWIANKRLRCKKKEWFWLVFEAKWNIFNSVSGQSLVTVYTKYPEMKLNVVYFTAVILIKMKFHFGDKMLCKQYSEMTSYENKHLRMQIERKYTIRIPVVKFVLQSKASCSKEIEYYLSLFPNEVSNIKLYIFR